MEIDLYRRGRISTGYLARRLGIAWAEVHDWLARRGVENNYGVAEF